MRSFSGTPGNLRLRQSSREFEDLVADFGQRNPVHHPHRPRGDWKRPIEEGRRRRWPEALPAHSRLFSSSLRDWPPASKGKLGGGRAELRLQDARALWKEKRENRHLPSLWEFLNIRLLTDRKRWASSERNMMGKAGRRYHRSGLICLAIVAVIAVVFAVNARYKDRNARVLVQTLLGVKTANVIDLVGDVDNYRQRAVPLEERRRRQRVQPQAEAACRPRPARVRDPSQAIYLSEQLLSAQVQVEEVPVIITLMEPQKPCATTLWEAVKKE